jgi:hypothetical protein
LPFFSRQGRTLGFTHTKLACLSLAPCVKIQHTLAKCEIKHTLLTQNAQLREECLAIMGRA